MNEYLRQRANDRSSAGLLALGGLGAVLLSAAVLQDNSDE